MSVHVLDRSEFLKKYKSSANEDEKLMVIADYIDSVQKENVSALVTNDKLESALSKQTLKLVLIMVGICGVWVPAIIGIITTLIFKHA